MAASRCGSLRAFGNAFARCDLPTRHVGHHRSVAPGHLYEWIARPGEDTSIHEGGNPMRVVADHDGAVRAQFDGLRPGARYDVHLRDNPVSRRSFRAEFLLDVDVRLEFVNGEPIADACRWAVRIDVPQGDDPDLRHAKTDLVVAAEAFEALAARLRAMREALP